MSVLTSGAVSVKAMEMAIYICIAGTSNAFMYFFARLKTGERPVNSGTVILHQIPRDLFTTLSAMSKIGNFPSNDKDPLPKYLQR